MENLLLLSLFLALFVGVVVLNNALLNWFLNTPTYLTLTQKLKSVIGRVVWWTLSWYYKIKTIPYIFRKTSSKEETTPLEFILKSEIVLPKSIKQKSDRQRQSKNTLATKRKAKMRGDSSK
jgi:hypothetical protein